MSKKGYQKRLPVVLPPTARRPSLPAPRRSPEKIEPVETIEPDRVVATAVTPVEQAVTPDRDGRSRGSLMWIAVIVLINLAAAGFLAFVIMGARTDPAEQRVPQGTGAADPPRMLAARESYVETRVVADGTIVVRQWIRSGEPLDLLRLSLPRIPGADGLAATRVEVIADGERADGPGSVTGGPVTYTFDRSVHLEVSYRLTGAVTRSSSAQGRALAVATTLDLTYAPRVEQETRVVRAPEVLSLACAHSPQEPLAPCGEEDSDRQWRVELTGSDVGDRVTAAVTID